MNFWFRTTGLLLLLSLVARAGSGQRVVIDSIKLTRVGGLYLPAARRGLVFSVEPKAGATRIRQFVFDPALGRQRRAEVRVSGRFQLISTATSRHHVLYQLHRRGYDTLLTVVVDTLGQVVAMRREHDAFPNWDGQLHSSFAPQAGGFLLGESVATGGAMLLSYLSPQLKQQWQHRFVSAEGYLSVAEAVSDSTHGWLLVTQNANSRRDARTTAYCLALATGTVLCRIPLDGPSERLVAGAGAMGPGHSLLVAGYAYPADAPSQPKTGRLFCTRLHPNGNSQNMKLAESPESRLLAARGRYVHWQTLHVEADGGVRLVGETYTTTPRAGYLALATASYLATLSIAPYRTTTLRPHDVVSLRIGPTGAITEVQSLPLPEGGVLKLSGFARPDWMAQLAVQVGAFRLRGFTPDSQRVVVRTPQRILTVNVRTGQATTVQPSKAGQYSDVWFTMPHHLLLHHEQRHPQRVELERVGY